MKAIITNFRMGRHTKSNNHMIIKVESIESKDKAKDLLNKKVIWKSPSGKEIKGIVKALHGNKGALRVIFEKGMPGQSIGSEVDVQ